MHIIILIICWINPLVWEVAEPALNFVAYLTSLCTPYLSWGSRFANLAGDWVGCPYFDGLKGRVANRGELPPALEPRDPTELVLLLGLKNPSGEEIFYDLAISSFFDPLSQSGGFCLILALLLVCSPSSALQMLIFGYADMNPIFFSVDFVVLSTIT